MLQNYLMWQKAMHILPTSKTEEDSMEKSKSEEHHRSLWAATSETT